MAENLFIHLRSPKFPLLPGEEEELINEGMFGQALALYLCENLPPSGWKVSEPVAEDWGWWLGASNGGKALDLCLRGEGDGSGIPELAVWVGTPKAKNPDAVTQLHADLLALLSADPGVEILSVSEAYPL